MPPYIPDLEVHVWQIDRSDILSDGRHRVACGVRGSGVASLPGRIDSGVEQGFDLGEEGCLAGVIETEQDYRVL